MENAEFKMHSFFVECDNVDNPPEIVKVSSYNYAVSLLNGSMDIIIDDHSNISSFSIHTPRVNLTLMRGKFRIIVQDKTTVVIVLSGNGYALNLAESKKLEITEGNFSIITTYVPLTSAYQQLNKPTANTKPIFEEDMENLKQTFESLSKLKQEMISPQDISQ